MKDLSFKTLLITDPMRVLGMDCGGRHELVSIPGEIRFLNDCVVVANKYLSQDGLIHMPL